MADIAHKKGAYLLIDDYQGTGQIPLNVTAQDIDFLVTGTLKWLMGGPGLALVYIREGLLPLMQPTIAGWFGHREQFEFKTRTFESRSEATRVELGTPAMPTVYTANGGLDIVLEIGVEHICERTRYLTDDLITRARGSWLAGARPPGIRAAQFNCHVGILSNRKQIVEELLKRDIIVDKRPGPCARLALFPITPSKRTNR